MMLICAVEKEHRIITIKDTALAVFDSSNNAASPLMGSIVVLRSFELEGAMKSYFAHGENFHPRFNYFQSLLNAKVTGTVKLEECANTQQIIDLFFDRDVSTEAQDLFNKYNLFK